jgi:hypothetical protein
VSCRLFLILAIVAVAAGCRDTPKTYPEPPASMYSTGTYRVKAGSAVVSVMGTTVVRSDFFLTAGVQPLLGRFFVEGDRATVSTGVVVLSHHFWKTHFNGSTAVVGSTIEVEDRSCVVVGIAPPDFDFPKGTALWIPRRD